MTITCPSCDASYRIDAATLGEGRKVRCARCRAEWFATAEPQAAEPPEPVSGPPPTSLAPIPSLDDAYPVDAIESDAARRPETLDAVVLPPRVTGAPRRWLRGRAQPAGRLGAPGLARRLWARRLLSGVRPVALAAAFGVAACGVVIGERVAIVGAAPSLASFYGAVGLPVNVRGLAIGELRSIEEVEEGVPLLLVTGFVENVSSAPLDVPRLRLAVTGGGDRELYAWTTVAARAKLGPGERSAFRARLASPPADGRGVAARFLARKDLVATASR